MLEKAGANPNQGTAHEYPLQMALQIGTRTGPGPVQMLLAAGAKPNLPDSSGRPIYFGAAGLGGNVELLALMLRRKFPQAPETQALDAGRYEE